MDTPIDIRLTSYSPDEETKKALKKCQILLLVGPTGSGKNTVVQELLKTGHYHQIVTYTTRSPRENHGVMEKEGDPYHFIDQDQAREMLKNKQFIEAALIHGNIYGTSLEDFEITTKESKIAITDMDVQGVKSYMQLTTNIKAIFLLPPSFRVMLERLANRYGGQDRAHDINVRLNTALFELYELQKATYYTPVINDDLEETVRAVQQIIAGNPPDKDQRRKARQQAKQLIDDISNYLAD